MQSLSLKSSSSFNPRLREGGDCPTYLCWFGCYKFQSTPPRGRRRFHNYEVRILQRGFNPRLREGGDITIFSLQILIKFQSTPPRGRRLLAQAAQGFPRSVSIHASAREATKRADKKSLMNEVSIHASAREATSSSKFAIIFLLFQSTPPRGRRLKCRIPGSTHICFNPRLREGGDEAVRCILLLICRFQSTPPRGRRLAFRLICQGVRCFNPRLREGGDPYTIVGIRTVSQFQSTPPRGRRQH